MNVSARSVDLDLGERASLLCQCRGEQPADTRGAAPLHGWMPGQLRKEDAICRPVSSAFDVPISKLAHFTHRPPLANSALLPRAIASASKLSTFPSNKPTASALLNCYL